MDDQIIEKLACLEHIQWQEWAGSVYGDLRTLLEIINENVDLNDLDSDKLEIFEKNSNRVKNWPELMIDYSDLSEEMKEKDRIYARKVYEICKNEFE